MTWKLTATMPAHPIAEACEIAMNDIDRLLYATTGIALASVFLLDETFSDNLFRAIGGEIPALSVNPWTAGLGAVFLVLAAVAIYREMRQR
jgi:hypothetical protein